MEHSGSPDELCIVGCKFNRKHDESDAEQAMVRCCQCASWMHELCIAEKEEFVAGIWCCFECRQTPSRIIDLQGSVIALVETVNNLRDEMKSRDTQHSQEYAALQESHRKLGEDHKGLLAIVNNLSVAPKPSEGPKAHGTLVLGSSIVRDVDATKLVATKCISVSSGCIKDIHSTLVSLPASDRFGNITLVVGGNDCDDRDEQKGEDISDIITQYRELIECAKMRADTITVSSVLPRNKPGLVSERIKSFNAGLMTLADDMEVIFVDNDLVFFLRDGSLNEGFLLPDHVHLAPAGTNRLAKSLGLKLRQGFESAHTDHRKRHPETTPPPALPQKEDEFGHSFWNTTWQKVKTHKRTQPHHSRMPNHAEQQKPFSHITQPPIPRDLPKPPSRNATHRPAPSRQGYASAVKAPPPRAQPDTRSYPPKMHHIPSLLELDTSPVMPSQSVRPRLSISDTCQLCHGAGHSAVTCRGRTATCYNCQE